MSDDVPAVAVAADFSEDLAGLSEESAPVLLDPDAFLSVA